MNSWTAVAPHRVDVMPESAAEVVQKQVLAPIVHSGSVPGAELSSYWVRMPPGHLTRAHVHHHSGVLVQVLRGQAATLWGEWMQPLYHGPLHQLWIPAGTPHAALNLSSVELLALEVRATADPNGDVAVLEELDATARRRADDIMAMRAQHSHSAVAPVVDLASHIDARR